LMLDLDNTIAPCSRKTPPSELLAWINEMKSAGIVLYIVSNSRREDRVSSFAGAFGIPYIYRAKKPSPRAVLRLLKKLRVLPENAALAGDQIYTDVLAANRAGAISIIVHPLKLINPVLALRFALELPFRAFKTSLPAPGD
ncbi:MAG: YqeG family HAD IIIA-type phosphatase, partial [Clostridiales bacterium]|nr:YqeG family HAD IIIA-type phosphatase [Clostridiales bacterium]